MICISRAPLEKLLAYRERMGWSFDWASSYQNDFNFDFGVSAGEDVPHAAAPLLGANEVAALPSLSDPRVRENLPPIAAPRTPARPAPTSPATSPRDTASPSSCAKATASITRYSSYARGTEFLMGYYAILDRTPKGRAEDGPMGTWLRRHDEYDA